MYMYYNAGAGYKEVTLKNHGNNGLAICMEASFFLGSILNGNFFVNPFSSDAYGMYVIGPVLPAQLHTYVHYSAGADELAIMHRIGFLPRRISSLILSVLS